MSVAIAFDTITVQRINVSRRARRHLEDGFVVDHLELLVSIEGLPEAERTERLRVGLDDTSEPAIELRDVSGNLTLRRCENIPAPFFDVICAVELCKVKKACGHFDRMNRIDRMAG
jgi:hypothetical protein